jgi:hypothetical protein
MIVSAAHYSTFLDFPGEFPAFCAHPILVVKEPRRQATSRWTRWDPLGRECELEAMALIEIDGLPVYLWKMLIFYSELLNYQRVMWLDNNKPPIWEWLKSHLFTFFQWGFQLESWCEIRLSFPYLFNLVSHVTFECKGRHIRTNQRLSGLYCNIFCCTCSSKATFVMST